MTQDQAIRFLFGLCSEYAETLKDKPVTQAAIVEKMREAHAALVPEPARGTDPD